jgi:hypothetical protein
MAASAARGVDRAHQRVREAVDVGAQPSTAKRHYLSTSCQINHRKITAIGPAWKPATLTSTESIAFSAISLTQVRQLACKAGPESSRP